jgi:hypothetical protein
MISPTVWLATAISATGLQRSRQIAGLGGLGGFKTLITQIAVPQDVIHNVRGVNGRLPFLTNIAKHISS